LQRRREREADPVYIEAKRAQAAEANRRNYHKWKSDPEWVARRNARRRNVEIGPRYFEKKQERGGIARARNSGIIAALRELDCLPRQPRMARLPKKQFAALSPSERHQRDRAHRRRATAYRRIIVAAAKELGLVP